MKDSFVTLLILFIFLGYFAFFGQIIFFASLQGATLMQDFGDSYWEFDVLFTTENFPDFVLPAYDTHYYSIVFFMLFIFIAVYFMGGILLSIVFDNYKNRIEEMSKEKLDKRIHYIKIFYDMYDDENLGYLTYKQARDFFEQVLNLNYLKRKHRKTIVRIIKIVDPEHYKIVLKERILDFFSISGFKIIAQLDNEQKRLHQALEKAKDNDRNATIAKIDKITARDIEISSASSDEESDYDSESGSSYFTDSRSGASQSQSQSVAASRSKDQAARQPGGSSRSK